MSQTVRCVNCESPYLEQVDKTIFRCANCETFWDNKTKKEVRYNNGIRREWRNCIHMAAGIPRRRGL